MADISNGKEERKQAKIVFYYDASKNDEGASFAGVPAGDILEHVYEDMPKWLQKSIEASPMYRKTPPTGKSESNTTSSVPTPKAKRAPTSANKKPSASTAKPKAVPSASAGRPAEVVVAEPVAEPVVENSDGNKPE